MSTPATVYISESNGAGEVVTDNISNINFGSVDQPNIVAANHPIIQSENSYFKLLRFKVQSLGTSTTIKDLRWWKSAGAYVTGETINVADRTSNAGGGGNQLISYSTPNQSLLTSFISGTAVIPLRTSDPGAATVGIGGAAANTFPANVAVPGYSEYMALSLSTTGSTPVGPVNQKTLTLQYDET